MQRLTMIAAAALATMAYAGPNDEAHGAAETREQMAEAREQMAEAREKMAEARARIAEAAKELAAVAKVRVLHSPQRAFLGVLIADQDQDGIHVAGISPDSGAAQAGLEAADVIIAINDESLRGGDRPLKVLHGALDDVEPGESVRLMILRDGEEQAVDVTTTAYFADSGLHDFHWSGNLDDVEVDIDLADLRDLPGFPPHAFLRDRRPDGLQLADIGEDLGDYFGVDAGVLVLDTPAKSELKPGDILKRIDGAAVSSAQDAYRLLRRLEEDAQAEVRRKNRKVTVDVAAASAPRVHARRMLFLDGDHDEEGHEKHEDAQDER